ncbi:MAG: cytosine deaminase [Halothiobacillaceae bacterium]|nr:MAG: cytosine deaminase [Halothiobacillaceae bacterium]
MIDFPTVWAKDADEYIHKGLELYDYYRSHPLITTTFAPHAPYTVSNQPLERIKMLADELDIPIHMHVQETEDEIAHSLGAHNERPLARLDRLALLSPRLLAVHMTQLTDAELTRFAASGAQVLHCPESNLKLASGFCPVAKLLDAGVNVALGTDGAASNNDLDMLGEMRTAALLGKGVAKSASAIPAHTALRMATLNGARALGLDNDIGSLQVGKLADITAIDFGELEMRPLYNPISHLVYSSSRHQVSDVWVAGRQLLKQRQLTTLDQKAILTKTRQWQHKIAANSVAPSHSMKDEQP